MLRIIRHPASEWSYLTDLERRVETPWDLPLAATAALYAALRSRSLVGDAVDQDRAQYGWPLGMPLIRKLDPGLWEIRSSLAAGIARVVFAVDSNTMVLL